MTHSPEILPCGGTPRTVLFLAYPDVGLLDLTGPQTVFWAASEAMDRRGLPGYIRHTASLSGGRVRTAEGLELQVSRIADLPPGIDTLVVPGSPRIGEVLGREGPMIAWLGECSGRVRRTASVCSGTFLLAKAGLLETRRAATHWGMCDRLQASHPGIRVDRDAIFIRDGPVWTSAGVSAGIDLALALVEEDCGREIAMEVARELVVFLKRPGGQSQFSELLLSQERDGGYFDDLHLWITGHLDRGDLSVEFLAGKAGMSPRNFARVYKLKTGRTPAKAVEIFRLEAARRLLESSARNIDEIARACGFGDEERMRLAFKRNLGVAPRDYRKRFSR